MAVDVKSTALLFADQTKPILAGFSTIFVSALAYTGYMNDCGPAWYAISVGGAAAHLAWQLRYVDLDIRPSCWKMFSANRDLGFIVWSGAALDYVLRSGLV